MLNEPVVSVFVFYIASNIVRKNRLVRFKHWVISYSLWLQVEKSSLHNLINSISLRTHHKYKSWLSRHPGIGSNQLDWAYYFKLNMKHSVHWHFPLIRLIFSSTDSSPLVKSSTTLKYVHPQSTLLSPFQFVCLIKTLCTRLRRSWNTLTISCRWKFTYFHYKNLQNKFYQVS